MGDRESEELLKSLDVAFVIVDRDKKIVYANRVARKKLFHNKPELFYGKDVRTFHDKHARKKIQRLYSEARKGRPSELPIIKLIDTSKGTIAYIVKMSEILDEKGGFNGFVAAFFDVTSLTINKSTNQIKKIPVRGNNEIVFIDVDKIVNIRAEGGKVYIFDNKQRKFVTNLSLVEIEKRFYSDGIFRAHRCCLVNLKYIKSIITDKKNKHFVEFIFDGIPPIPISRRSYTKLKKLFPFGFR